MKAGSGSNGFGEGMKMSGNNQVKKKNAVRIMRDLFYGIKQKQKPTPELNEAVKHRRSADTTKGAPERKTQDRKVARPKSHSALDL